MHRTSPGGHRGLTNTRVEGGPAAGTGGRLPDLGMGFCLEPLGAVRIRCPVVQVGVGGGSACGPCKQQNRGGTVQADGRCM